MAEETSLGEYIESEAGGGRAVAGRSREVLTVEEARHAALYYHDLGWAVTAGPGLDEVGNCACHDGAKCHNPGKHAYAGWGEPDRRTMNREQIERYWSVDNAR